MTKVSPQAHAAAAAESVTVFFSEKVRWQPISSSASSWSGGPSMPLLRDAGCGDARAASHHDDDVLQLAVVGRQLPTARGRERSSRRREDGESEDCRGDRRERRADMSTSAA
jgi:hypothetical protein